MKSLTDKQEVENPDNNLLNIYGFIGIVSFLPVWIFRGNLYYFEVIILSVIFAIKTKKIPSGSYDDNVTTNHLFFKFSN